VEEYFRQLFNVQEGGGSMQTEIHTAEPFVPAPCAAEIKAAIRQLKRYMAPGSDKIPAELIQAGGETLPSGIHKLITLIWNKEELPHQWKESIFAPIHKKGDKTAVIIEAYHCCQLHTTFYLTFLSRLIPYADEIIGDLQCGFRRNRSTTNHIFYIRQILEKKWEYNGTVHQLFIDFKKAYVSVRMEALYNILIEFGIPRKLDGLIKVCLNESYSRVRIGKNLWRV
jgi:hypothetical protein